MFAIAESELTVITKISTTVKIVSIFMVSKVKKRAHTQTNPGGTKVAGVVSHDYCICKSKPQPSSAIVLTPAILIGSQSLAALASSPKQ